MQSRKPCHVARGMATLVLMLFGLMPALAAPGPATAAGSSISLSRSMAAPGDAVKVSGSGYQPGDNAVVIATVTVQTAPKTYSHQQVTASAHIDGAGAFSATVTLPGGTVPGKYRVTARDSHNHSAALALEVLRLIELKSGKQGPKVAMIAGQPFYIVGSGFKAGETVHFAATFPLYGGNSLNDTKSATADKKGGFGEVLMRVPWAAKDGDVALQATGSSSGKGGAGGATVSVFHKPFIWLGSKTVRPGQSVTVHGVGFVPGAQITVSVTISRPGSTNLTLSKSVTAGGHGDFQTSMKVPSNVGQGTYTVKATGSVANFHASTSLNITLSAGVSVQPSTASPGQKITVTGSGYSAGVKVQVTVTFPLFGGGTKPVSMTATTDNSGAFKISLQVPGHAAAGTVTVRAKGPNTQATAKLQIGHLGVHISLTPPATRPGSNVRIDGAGFLSGAKIDISVTVKLTDGSTKTLTTSVTTNSKGQFSVQLHVPGNVASGSYSLVAKSEASGRATTARLIIGKLAPSIVLGPVSAIPGSTVTVRGSGYLPSTKITITLLVKLTNGSVQKVSVTVTTDKSGAFKTSLKVPGDASGGTYVVTAKSEAGRSANAKLVVAVLKPSVVVVPTMAVPGTPITVTGFGFASGATITISLSGTKLGTATANGAGQFKVLVKVPGNTATGTYSLSAQSSSGRKASISLKVYRKISTHFYFASFYTGRGYHEYLLFVNTSEIRAQVRITYQLKSGAPRSKAIAVGAHSHFTEDVNKDLGAGVSAAAVIATDVPIAAERMVLHGTDGAIDPGATSPSKIWYFANGNTTHGYHENLAIQNPTSGSVKVTVHFQPTHSRPVSTSRTMRPQSQTTLAVSRYVHDAVGVVITANGPIVANRTIFIHHGLTSKTGVTGPQTHWYFAAGPKRGSPRHWIGVTNTSGRRSHLVLHAYGPDGAEMGTVNTWIRPYAREGYLMNKVAGQADVAVLVTTSQPSIAEQSTFMNGNHDAHADIFGVAAPMKSWQFAEATTWRGQDNVLDVFNPNVAPIPIVVQFLNAGGARTQRTYVVPPLAHERIDAGSVMPNAQLGLLAASNVPFVALDRQLINNGAGAMTSPGVGS